MRTVDYFSRDVATFWSTTYELDLKLFDQFLLRRLGQQPLNAVILCDENSLSHHLASLTELDRHVAAAANRRYLLRGVRLSSGGRFHPKTYYFSGRRTALLVGSGNLTRTGLDRGREVFTEFIATRGEDVAVFYEWAAWVGSLVETRGDPALSDRYERLRSTLPAADASSSRQAVRSLGLNSETPLLTSLSERAPSEVHELHVSAPFFDRRALALQQLIDRLRPSREIHVYLGGRASVDRDELASVLGSAPPKCRVSVHAFEPRDFVHAKLIGIIGSESSLLVSGSANLSQAALLRAYAEPDPGANCEVAVLSITTAEQVRQVFRPPGLEAPIVDLTDVEDVEYRDDGERYPAFPLQLVSAALGADRRVQIRVEGQLHDDAYLASDERGLVLALNVNELLTEPLPDDANPLVVWIETPEGAPLSNRVVLDDPEALNAILGEKVGGNKPHELLDDAEDSELVALLAWAHRRFIFDIDDTEAVRRASRAQESQAEPEDVEFWERYAREELAYDERSQTYRPLTGHTLTDEDLLLREIEAMLRAAPGERQLRLVRKATTEDDSPQRTGRPWSLSARQQVRARNLLQRWARALGDPRHAWLASSAPGTNYEALLEVLCLLWLGDGLDDEKIVDLLGLTWTSLLGGENKRGVLDRLEPDIAAEAVAAVSLEGRQVAAGVAAASLASGRNWTSYIYDWQPFLLRGMELELFAFDEFAVDIARALGADVEKPEALETLLLQRSKYVDDETWGQRMAQEFDLAQVSIIPSARFKGVSLAVTIQGLPVPERDPRLIAIARRALSLKQVDDVLIDVQGERFLLRMGSTVVARLDGELRESVVALDRERLAAVEEQAGTLAELLGIAS